MKNASGILIAMGFGSTIYGFYLNNSVEARLKALLSNGTVNPGTIWIVAGIIALVIGLVLMTRKHGSAPSEDAGHTADAKTRTLCSNCGKELVGSPAFCPFCGKDTHT